jgi:hypothetical protein
MESFKQPPHRRAFDRIRKANDYARKRIETKKELLLRSFKEDNNFYEALTRLKEMEALSSGVLTGVDGPTHFTTLPNANQLKIAEKDPSGGFKRGYEQETKVIGCVPLHLMSSLLNDLKTDEKFGAITTLGQEIGRSPKEVENVKERGVYFMLHWQRTGIENGKPTYNEKMLLDWKVMNENHYHIFSFMAVAQIEKFGKSILKTLGLKGVSRTTHTFAPGVVYTEDSYSQAAHLDFDETSLEPTKKSWIIHLPLQKEGMLLSIWDLPIVKDERHDQAKHDYIFVPFGSYIALRSDVLHSGVYGSSGNSRFHMILKSKNDVQVSDSRESLFYHPHDRDKDRPLWQPAFNDLKKRFTVYTNKYIEELQKHTGLGNDLAPLLKCKEWNKKGKTQPSRVEGVAEPVA